MNLSDIAKNEPQVFGQISYLLKTNVRIPQGKYKPYPNTRMHTNSVTNPRYVSGEGMKQVTVLYPYYVPYVTFKVLQEMSVKREEGKALLQWELLATTGGISIPVNLFRLLYGERLGRQGQRTVLHSERKKLLQEIFSAAFAKIPQDLQANVVLESSSIIVPAPDRLPWKKDEKYVEKATKLSMHILISNPANDAVIHGILKNILQELFITLEKYCEEQKV